MTLSMSHKAVSQIYGSQFQTTSVPPTIGGPANSPLRSGETIHSGQFMVSDFEAEAQDEDDTEIKMPDPDDPNLEKEAATDSDGSTLKICTAVQRYIPQPGTSSLTRMRVSSKIEIETTLAKLFKCMNLAYSQKLTSPKWNHFKGVRLRWKDKIRLNNVIWRCWHMQFFLKRRTPVCQFASPLDVDIHSNPQSVVLEGKYWKRQLEVIQAEYRKWRRNFKSNAIGALTCDSKSEFDFSEWPMLNDRFLMSTDDWATETLFSAIKINEPFPFPDPREIARDAGRADFIQPSLGSLQPSLDDIDISTFQALLNTHLEPVPEEGTDDILKSIDCFPMMGSEQMDSTNIDELANNSQSLTMNSSMQDTNMMEINSMGSIRYAGNMEIDQNATLISTQQTENNQMINSCNYRGQMIESAKLQNSMALNNFPSSTTGNLNKAEDKAGVHMGPNQFGYNERILKGRITKNARPFRRREPHNYDKAQPTTHQTLIYQQMLAEQQQQQATQMIGPMQYSQQYSNASVVSTPNFPTQSMNSSAGQEMKSYSFPQPSQTFSMLNQNLNNTSSEIMSILNQGPDAFKPNLVQQQTSPNSSYRLYNNVSNFKKSSSTAGYITLPVQNDIRQPSPPRNHFIANKHQSQQTAQQPQQTAQQQLAKEMFRSNSLPLNTTLPKFPPKEEPFLVPKYQAKSSRPRTRSNSMQQHPGTSSSSLQAATSEPMLNSTLAQLLTSNSNKKLTAKQSISTSAITSLPPSGFSSTFSNSNNMQQAIVQTPQLTQHSVIQHQQQQQVSPTRSISLPQPTMQSSTDKIFNFSASSLTPTASFSPESYADPGSPVSPTRASSSASSLRYPRDNQRRAGHIHAEQKRRCNIKNGFDMLHSLIPQLQQNPNAKLSKAATLQKAAEYIKQLRSERNTIKDKKESLQKERDGLNNSLTHLHSILPANGAPVSRQRTERVKQLYNQYVRYKTEQNWKFWILGLILEPLISSYTTTVSVASIEELYRTALLWVDQHCSLVELRPAVSNKLRYLSTTTDILSDPPSSLKDEVLKAINNSSGEHPNLTSS